MQKLILWDIDGTLIYSGGIAGECMRAAMQQVYGASSTQERHQYAGKTDRQIILETFPEREPASLFAQLDRFTEVYLTELKRQEAEMRRRGRILAGAQAALAELQNTSAIQTTLTGNLAAIARWKLELMQLMQFVDLDVGAFGSDHHLRNELPAIAAKRAAARYGRSFIGTDVVVVGDTPNDIACGKAYGARTIAVASGPFSTEQLAHYQPDAVLASLEDTAAVLAALLG
jgi:phosphoglycolate phosphatase